jgi:hypothetical protein
MRSRREPASSEVRERRACLSRVSNRAYSGVALDGSRSHDGSAMNALEPLQELTPAELRDLRRLAGIMIPASAESGVPGADDAAIFADIVHSLGRDRGAVSTALAMLCEIVGGDFALLDEAKAEAAAMTLLGSEDPVVVALGRAVLQCYYRDDRVMRALGIEPRPPYPQGRVLEPGDWSLLDAVRGRPRMWRDVDGRGG